jgi:hypothetical protein
LEPQDLNGIGLALTFDHTSSNEWLHAAGAKIIAQDNRRKYLSEVQHVEDWDYNLLSLSPGGVPSEMFSGFAKITLTGGDLLSLHVPGI